MISTVDSGHGIRHLSERERGGYRGKEHTATSVDGVDVRGGVRGRYRGSFDGVATIVIGTGKVDIDIDQTDAPYTVVRIPTLLPRIGWILFICCAALYGIANIRAGDWFSLAGSVLFLAACVVFLVHEGRKT